MRQVLFAEEESEAGPGGDSDGAPGRRGARGVRQVFQLVSEGQRAHTKGEGSTAAGGLRGALESRSCLGKGKPLDCTS